MCWRSSTIRTVFTPLIGPFFVLSDVKSGLSQIVYLISVKHHPGNMIGDHDLVISLLPYTFHPMVAKLAIEKKVNMVTASYLSPGMEELDSLAKSSGKDLTVRSFLTLKRYRFRGDVKSGCVSLLQNPATYRKATNDVANFRYRPLLNQRSSDETR